MTEVSIIMPVYNSEKYLAQAIDSIQNQTFTNWELIIIDDASSDSSAEIIQYYAKSEQRIIPIYLSKNVGAAQARNIGISHVTSRYLTFLDSDDIWKPEKLKIQISFMQEHSYAFTYTSYDLISEDGRQLNIEVPVPFRISYSEALTRTAISTITVCLDLAQIGNVTMPLLNGAEDTGTWLSILKSNDYAYGINTVLASYRQVPTSLSHNLCERLIRNWRLYRKVEKFSVAKSLVLYIRYIFYVLRKRKRVRL